MSIDTIAGTATNQHGITYVPIILWNVIRSASVVSLNLNLAGTAYPLDIQYDCVSSVTADVSVTCPLRIAEKDNNTFLLGELIAVRRLYALISWLSGVIIDEVYRTRSLYSVSDQSVSYYWNVDRLRLISRITSDVVGKSSCHLARTIFMREGKPALRIEPMKWFRSRIKGGDIVILEDPWL